jgi:hypothetical protein
MRFEKLYLMLLAPMFFPVTGFAVEINHPEGCDIKGNVGNNYKFYYLPEHENYPNVEIDKKGDRWFCTEDEALAAGWLSAGSLHGRVGKKAPKNSCVISPDAPNANCAIKGNINSKGERIFHEPCSKHYGDTEVREKNGERWFCSQDEAIASGWRAPKN